MNVANGLFAVAVSREISQVAKKLSVEGFDRQAALNAGKRRKS
jgi:hypothetical protein